MPRFTEIDRWAMRRAIELAHHARTLGEVPVGCVILQGERILSESFNLRESLFDPTAHAERLALTLAGRSLRTWRLDDCTLYATLEPCPMCAGAILQSRLSRLVFGATDSRAGSCRSLYRLLEDRRLNHQCRVDPGLFALDCGQLLTDFFFGLR